MRELEVLGNGHLKLDFAECKEFFEQELAERVRAQLKRLIEQVLLAEQDPNSCFPPVLYFSRSQSIHNFGAM